MNLRACCFRSAVLVGTLAASLFSGHEARAQFWQEGYDDYGSFSTDPADLDTEVSDLFGRYFESQVHLGTAILTGDLGKAYSAGVLAGLRFMFYFDRIW